MTEVQVKDEDLVELKSLIAGQSELAMFHFKLRREYLETEAKLTQKIEELQKKVNEKVIELRDAAGAPEDSKLDLTKKVFVKA